MSTYDHLPVYKASYDLLLDIFETVKNFKKEYKYSLGESLKNETIALITGIYRANSQTSKRAILQQAREHVEVIRLFVRLLHDLKQITINKFVSMNEKIESVSKQLTGWQRASPE